MGEHMLIWAAWLGRPACRARERRRLTQGLDLVHATHVAGSAADLHHIHGIVVARGVALGVLVAGVLPGLGQQAVVPVDVVGVEAQLALLGVLLDGGAGLVSGDLHLGGRLLGDLAHKVQEAVACRGERVKGARL
jgi:hypothetical protein